MSNSPLTSLIQYTYVRSTIIYRISLLSEFFDFVFFTAHDNSNVDKDIIEKFAISRKEPQKDIDFLKALPQTFVDMFTRDSFHTILQDMSDELQKFPVLSIVLPVEFSVEHTDEIGKWAREAIASNIVLDISVDTSISVGCRFVWENNMHDFSIEHYFSLHKEDLDTQITSHVFTKEHV